jgi:ribosomal protein S3|tara:strand:+ start:525 stop:782 length:258 start_codon:yes stop_codon:yes gene_type:complete
MPQQEFDNSKDTRLGGLWLHANGRYYEGSIEIEALKEAVNTAQSAANCVEGRVKFKVWVNNDKRDERSPDLSVTVTPQFPKKDRG